MKEGRQEDGVQRGRGHLAENSKMFILSLFCLLFSEKLSCIGHEYYK